MSTIQTTPSLWQQYKAHNSYSTCTCCNTPNSSSGTICQATRLTASICNGNCGIGQWIWVLDNTIVCRRWWNLQINVELFSILNSLIIIDGHIEWDLINSSSESHRCRDTSVIVTSWRMIDIKQQDGNADYIFNHCSNKVKNTKVYTSSYMQLHRNRLSHKLLLDTH